jgi:hypothetical protein
VRLDSGHIGKFSLKFEPATLEVKGKCANHFATDVPLGEIRWTIVIDMCVDISHIEVDKLLDLLHVYDTFIHSFSNITCSKSTNFIFCF